MSSASKRCRVCPLKEQYLIKPNHQEGQQMSFYPKNSKPEIRFMERMKEKIDSPMGRHVHSKGLGTVESMFGNLETSASRSESKIKLMPND